MYENFNNRLITQGVFLDFSKAFDTINHDILIAKLPFYNFSSHSCHLIKNYLQDRKQFVSQNRICSNFHSVQIGVPQGSVLGPLLFLIYINDLLKSAPELNYILFADDTNIFSTDAELLSDQLNNVNDWCIANRLVINYDKTFQVIFKASTKSFNPLCHEINISNKALEQKPSTKFLGIELDSTITFKEHFKSLSKKLNINLMMMRALRQYVDQKTMIDIYYSFFYPHLIYGVEFWGHAADTNLREIKVLQKNALRVIFKVKPGDHISSFFKRHKIMPVKMIFEYRTLKLLLKTHETDEILNMKTDHGYNTRHNLPKKVRTNNKRGERSLLSTGIDLFNKYLLEVWTGPGCDLSVGLAERLWAHW